MHTETQFSEMERCRGGGSGVRIQDFVSRRWDAHSGSEMPEVESAALRAGDQGLGLRA